MNVMVWPCDAVTKRVSDDLGCAISFLSLGWPVVFQREA